MLVEVRVENLGLLKEAHLELDGGLNVITGETGAGKTLCVEALSYLCGSRAPRDAVGPWGNSSTIEARFLLDHATQPRLITEISPQQNTADPLDSTGEIVVRRIIDAGGKSRQYLNGCMATVTEIERALGDAIQIYGQFSVQALGDPRRQLSLLDFYVGAPLFEELDVYAATYQKATSLRRYLEQAVDAREIAREIDFLRHQVAEITAARLRQGEEEELYAELRRLEAAEELRTAAAKACELLESAQDAVGRAGSSGPETGCDPTFDELRGKCRVFAEELQELRRAFRSYFDSVDSDDQRLAQVRERLDLLGDLKRKYGRSTTEVFEFLEHAQSRLEELEGSERRSEALERELDALTACLIELGSSISRKRREGAAGLERSVQELLPRLGMAGATFKVGVSSKDPSWPDGFGAVGCDSVMFAFSPMPGMPPKPLHKVGSGGELARLMLAIEVSIGGKEGVPTLVFDEVDQGVGGAAAVAVGELLASIAETRQVICVTHLAQVASYGDCHFVIEKGPAGARARRLDPGDRVKEISRMLSGQATSRAANKHAQEILQRAASKKAS